MKELREIQVVREMVNLGIDQVIAEKAVKTLWNQMKQATKVSDIVKIRGVGRFTSRNSNRLRN